MKKEKIKINLDWLKKHRVSVVIILVIIIALAKYDFNFQNNCKEEEQLYLENESYQYMFKYSVVEDSNFGTLEKGKLNWITKQVTKISNFEDKGGNFKVIHKYRTLKKSGIKEISEYIDAHETKDLSTEFDTSFGEDVEVNTNVVPATETRYKEVIKIKLVEVCN